MSSAQLKKEFIKRHNRGMGCSACWFSIYFSSWHHEPG